jgi:hypothetical protein
MYTCQRTSSSLILRILACSQADDDAFAGNQLSSGREMIAGAEAAAKAVPNCA